MPKASGAKQAQTTRFHDEMEGIAEEIPVPADMTPAQQTLYRQLMSASSRQGTGFSQAAAEVLARNPDVAAKYADHLRKRTVERVAASLASCTKIVDLPLSQVEILLSLPVTDVKPYLEAVSTLRKAEMLLTKAEVKDVLDLARVINIMEEEDAPDEQMSESSDLLSPQIAVDPAYRTYSKGVDRVGRARLARDRLAKT